MHASFRSGDEAGCKLLEHALLYILPCYIVVQRRDSARRLSYRDDNDDDDGDDCFALICSELQ